MTEQTKPGKASPRLFAVINSNDFDVSAPESESASLSQVPKAVQEELMKFFSAPRQPTTAEGREAFDLTCEITEHDAHMVACELAKPASPDDQKKLMKRLAAERAELVARLDVLCGITALQGNDAAQAARPLPAPASEPAASMPAWSVSKYERFTGYNVPLHALLIAAHREGKPRPKAQDVLEAWRICLPREIAQVLPDGFDCYNNAGNTKHVGIAAIREAIRRMTKTR